MTFKVGVYRGAFDPPHNGHVETVQRALSSGMKYLVVVYSDKNPFKPFRTADKIRAELLKKMFIGDDRIKITKKSFEKTLEKLIKDPTIALIYQIIRADGLNIPAKPVTLLPKLECFIVPIDDCSMISNTGLNGLPSSVAENQMFTERHVSSAHLRNLLSRKNYSEASTSIPPDVFETILTHKYFIPSENEYKLKNILDEAKKIVTHEIINCEIVSHEKYPLTFHMGCDLGLTGLSQDIVCFIKDKNGQIIFVVKIFLENNFLNRFESEVVGYQTISKLDLRLVKVPKLLFAHHEESFAIIGIGFAYGKPLVELMHNFPDAIRLCAKANLELHTALQLQLINVKKEQIVHFEETIIRITNQLSHLSHPIATEELLERMHIRWQQLHLEFVVNPGRCCFTHGDPNHSNWIVDLENNHVTYIDLSLFKQSVSIDGSPLGFAANELEEAILSFKVAGKRIEGMSEDKIFEMQTIYREAYLKDVPEGLITPEATEYFSSFWTLRVIESIINQINNLDASNVNLPRKQRYLKEQINIFLKEDFFTNP